MKKALTGLAIISILAVGAFAFAHGPGSRGGGQMMGSGYAGHMMEPADGGHMMDPGYRGHMRDRSGPGYHGNAADGKFLDETADLRKDLHDKRFDYYEANRNPETKTDTLAKLEKEIYTIQEKIREKAPRTAYGNTGRYGYCR